MKKAIVKIATKLMGGVSAIAMFLAVSSVGAACYFWAYQPDVPEGLKKYED